MKVRTVPIQNRLYAFCIDLFIVVGIKILSINTIATYFNSLLMTFHKSISILQMESSMGLFLHTVFPIFYLTYFTLSYYIWDSTVGSKTMGYHFGNVGYQETARLSLKQCFIRSTLNLCNIYSLGLLGIYSYYSKQKEVFTDLMTASKAINNTNGIEYDLVVIKNDDNNFKEAA